MATRTERVVVQVSPEIKEALEAVAADHDMSVSSWILSIFKPVLIEKGYIESKKRKPVASEHKT